MFIKYTRRRCINYWHGSILPCRLINSISLSGNPILSYSKNTGIAPNLSDSNIRVCIIAVDIISLSKGAGINFHHYTNTNQLCHSQLFDSHNQLLYKTDQQLFSNISKLPKFCWRLVMLIFLYPSKDNKYFLLAGNMYGESIHTSPPGGPKLTVSPSKATYTQALFELLKLIQVILLEDKSKMGILMLMSSENNQNNFSYFDMYNVCLQITVKMKEDFVRIKCIILTCFTDIFSFSNSASCRTSSALESSIFLWLRASSLRTILCFKSVALRTP
ncbi:hypothetical protein AGLY_003052 [Aphis glycines]|uniref:Uncharacterized protein n=1 Tax=Aphis glycines TaxID=307491 RepID=A0A6G0U201_APHGL|nr:hypothetical protein AGLY_003052 [Aphis glycines]